MKNNMRFNSQKLREFPTGLLILIVGVLLLVWHGRDVFSFDSTEMETIDVPAGVENLVLTIPSINDPPLQLDREASLAIMDMRVFNLPPDRCPKLVVATIRPSWYPMISLLWRQASDPDEFSLRVFLDWVRKIKASTRSQAATLMVEDAMSYYSNLERRIRKVCPGVDFKIANLKKQHSKVCLFNTNVFYGFFARTIIPKITIDRHDERLWHGPQRDEIFPVRPSRSQDPCGWADHDILVQTIRDLRSE